VTGDGRPWLVSEYHQCHLKSTMFENPRVLNAGLNNDLKNIFSFKNQYRTLNYATYGNHKASNLRAL
jgi:hypothetical protein